MIKQQWLIAEKNLIKKLKIPFLKNIERNELKFLESRDGIILAVDKEKNAIVKIKERR